MRISAHKLRINSRYLASVGKAVVRYLPLWTSLLKSRGVRRRRVAVSPWLTMICLLKSKP